MPPAWRVSVADQVVHVVQQRLGLGKVAVAEQVDVEVGDSHGVDARRHGVGGIVAGTGRFVQSCGEMDRQVAVLGVQGRSLGVLGVETG